MSRPRLCLGCCAALWAVACPALLGASFRGLGFVPGEHENSGAFGISGDGSTVVGVMSGYPFRWSHTAGVELLSAPPGTSPGGVAYAASFDGSVIVGQGETFSPDTFGTEGFRWTASEGRVGLGHFPPNGLKPLSGSANSVSADGSIVVGVSGFSRRDFGEGSAEGPALWEQGVLLPRNLTPDDNNEANDVSADGTVVVFGPFAWRDETGPVGFPNIPDGLSYPSALGISADASVVVGRTDSPRGQDAFRWSEPTGSISLGELPGGDYYADAWATSADGSIVVGASSTDTPLHYLGLEAFIWDEASGMRRLQDVLTSNFGLDVTGWTLEVAKDISWDGRVIVGYGTNPQGFTEAWVAVIPEPSSWLLATLAISALVLARRRLSRRNAR